MSEYAVLVTFDDGGVYRGVCPDRNEGARLSNAVRDLMRKGRGTCVVTVKGVPDCVIDAAHVVRVDVERA